MSNEEADELDRDAESGDPPSLGREDLALLEAVHAAWAPSDPEPEVVLWAVQGALGNEDAEALRLALERRAAHPDAELLEALEVAYEPEALRPGAHEAALAGALARRPGRAKTNVVYAAFGSVGVLAALAAGFVLFLKPLDREARDLVAEPVLPAISRSSADLFDRAFERGKTTERIDRIATARARDLRANRYLSWGIE